MIDPLLLGLADRIIRDAARTDGPDLYHRPFSMGMTEARLTTRLPVPRAAWKPSLAFLTRWLPRRMAAPAPTLCCCSPA